MASALYYRLASVTQGALEYGTCEWIFCKVEEVAGGVQVRHITFIVTLFIPPFPP